MIKSPFGMAFARASPPAFGKALPKGHFQNSFTIETTKKPQNGFACVIEAKIVASRSFSLTYRGPR